MPRWVTRSAVLTLAMLCLAAASFAQNMLSNGSFESNLTSWTTAGGYTISVRSGTWNSITAQDGTRFLTVSGPATVGYSYVDLVSQSKSAPFGTGIPNDNFVVYLFAYTWVHTNDGRRVSFALTIEPGYGQMGSTFVQGTQDAWVNAQTQGYYYAHDPFDATSTIKPLKVTLELRDSLQSGEYIALDNVYLAYGGPGIPEPSSVAGLAAGLCVLGLRRRLR